MHDTQGLSFIKFSQLKKSLACMFRINKRKLIFNSHLIQKFFLSNCSIEQEIT